MEEIVKLKRKEEKEIRNFISTCEKLQDIDSSLWSLHNELVHAGGQSQEILHRAEVMSSTKSLLARYHYQERKRKSQ